jgi:hypothetical protein
LQQTSEQSPPASTPAKTESSDLPAAKTTSTQRPASLFDAQKALKLAKDLESHASLIAAEPRCGWGDKAPAHLELIRDEITTCRLQDEQLKNQIIDIETRSRGTTAKPNLRVLRGALATENIRLAETWLWNALDAEAFSKPGRAKTYLRGVKVALERADKLIRGRMKVDPDDIDSAVVAVPKYIEAADQQM